MHKYKNNEWCYLLVALEDVFLVGGIYSEGTWRYWDDQLVPSNLWGPTHPDLDIGKCVALTEDGLKTIDCQAKYYFICGY